MRILTNRMLLAGALTVASAGTILATSKEQIPDCGTIERLNIVSPELSDTMEIDVWLPDDYTPDSAYAVLYMHDGQNLFDAATTWNHQSWEMDRTACELLAAYEVRPFIIVGVHSDPERRVSQLAPNQALTPTTTGKLLKRVGLEETEPLGDAYAAFVVNTLKPAIDARYSTLKGRDDTFVMGSSMGGLMSLYLLCMYPDVFGGAGCLSTHWYGADYEDDSFGNDMMEFVSTRLPDPTSHRIYFDHGTATIDQWYGPWNTRALSIAQERGYRYGENLDSYVDPGAPHEESAWAARTPRPLKFLLGR